MVAKHATITLTDSRDIQFSKIAQGAVVNETILPSGFKTPAHDLVIEGEKLVDKPYQRLDMVKSRVSKSTFVRNFWP